MAHEWGHYAYGMYDEYAGNVTSGEDYIPRSTDTPASPSIMNNQWCAAGGGCPAGFSSPDMDFLEFSTDQIAPFDGTLGTNAQERMFGQSAWETLVQDTNNDPKRDDLPERTHYATLDAVAPPADGDYTVNNDESACLDSLDIRWMQGDIITELVLDRSGSMYGDPLTNAKVAAKILIDQLPEGSSAVGVASFASDVTQDFPVTEIPNPDTTVKVGAKAEVDALYASGSTSLYDGLVLGLNNVENFAAASGQPNRAKVVFLLSDGADNDSIATSAEVIASYQAASVPIIAFAYGYGAPDVLLELASATGGLYLYSPTTLAEIQAAFLAANAAVSSSLILENDTVAAAVMSTTTETIPVDSTLSRVYFTLTYGGSIGDIDIGLLSPNGALTNVGFTCESPVYLTVSCSGILDDTSIATYGTGNYSLTYTNNATGDIDVNTIISAEPTTGETYDIAIASTQGDVVNYPYDAKITASVRRNTAIAGLSVTAEVTDPYGVVSVVNLYDDGINGDEYANDGTYTAIITYTRDGNYNIVVNADNSAGTGVTTVIGEQISINADGTVPPAADGGSITENFSRSGTVQFAVDNFQLDDHDDDPAGGQCTLIFDDNADTRGRIDAAGDIDCFQVVATDTASDISIRVTGLTNDMDPILQVYQSDGATEITSGDLSTSENPDSGVILTVAATDIDPAGMIFTVQHVDSAAVSGGYDVSAGLAIISDKPVDDTPAAVEEDDDEESSSGGGGGSAGPWMLLIMLTSLISNLWLRRRQA